METNAINTTWKGHVRVDVTDVLPGPLSPSGGMFVETDNLAEMSQEPKFTVICL